MAFFGARYRMREAAGHFIKYMDEVVIPSRFQGHDHRGLLPNETGEEDLDRVGALSEGASVCTGSISERGVDRAHRAAHWRNDRSKQDHCAADRSIAPVDHPVN